MKFFQKILTAGAVIPAALVFSGCAAPGPEISTPVAGLHGVEKIQPSPTADMNFAEKTGYYVGWVSLEMLYAFAAGNPSF